MEGNNTSLNGHRQAVLAKELITDADNLEKVRLAETDVLIPEKKTAPLVMPDADLARQEPNPQHKRSLRLILAVLGVGSAIAASSFSYRWWQYGSS